MEAREGQADTTNALVVASNSTGTIAFGPTITSSSEQVTLQASVLNQPITPLMYFAPKTNSNIFTGL